MFKILKFVKTIGRIFTIWIYCIDSNKYSGSPKSHRMLYYFFNLPAITKFCGYILGIRNIFRC